MLLPLAYKTLKYHPTQAALYHDSVSGKVRHSLVVAGRGSGKTTVAKRRIVRALLKAKPGEKFLYGMPTYDQVRRVAWQDLKKLIPEDFKEYENDSSMKIITKVGTELYCMGMQQPERVEGTQWSGMIIDEMSDHIPGMFDRSCIPALSEYRAWTWRIGVPKRYGTSAPEFKEAFDMAASGFMPDSKAYHWRSDSILSKEEIESNKRRLSQKDYDEQFGAEWVGTSGLVYFAFSDANIGNVAYNPNKPLIVGSDFNVSPMAWVLAHPRTSMYRLEQDGIEVFDEIYEENTNTLETLRLLHQRYGNHKDLVYFFGDATARSRKTSASMSDYVIIENFNGFPTRQLAYPESNPPVADRIAAVNAALENASGKNRIVIDSRCEHLIKDLKLQPWKVVPINKPAVREPQKTDVIGHAVDALGYIVFPCIPMYEFTGGVYFGE